MLPELWHSTRKSGLYQLMIFQSYMWQHINMQPTVGTPLPWSSMVIFVLSEAQTQDHLFHFTWAPCFMWLSLWVCYIFDVTLAILFHVSLTLHFFVTLTMMKLHFTLATLFHITFSYVISLNLNFIISFHLALLFFLPLLATTALFFAYYKYSLFLNHTTWESAHTGVYLPETNVLGLFWVPCDWRTVRTPAASWCWRGSAGESWPLYTPPAPLRIPGMPAEITTKYKLHTGGGGLLVKADHRTRRLLLSEFQECLQR